MTPVALKWLAGAVAVAAASIMAGILIGWLIMLMVPPAHAAGRQCGIASWYGRESGRVTANGERFPSREATAAHRTLPFGTRVRVTLAGGRSCIVRINDRGPWIRGRIIDLSPAAARACGVKGLARVCIERVK